MKYLFTISAVMIINICTAQTNSSSSVVGITEYEKGNSLLKQSSFNQAIIQYTLVIVNTNKGDSLTTKSLMERAYCLEMLGDFDLAISDYRNVLEYNSKDENALLQLSGLYGELGRFEECFSTIEKHLEISPTNFYALHNYSYYKNQNNKYSDAITYANSALKYCNNPVWKGIILSNQGYSYLKLNNLKTAKALVDESIKINPNNSFAFRNRALIHIENKDLEKACDDIRKCRDLGGISLTNELMKHCK